jgi:hypothetical protein
MATGHHLDDKQRGTSQPRAPTTSYAEALPNPGAHAPSTTELATLPNGAIEHIRRATYSSAIFAIKQQHVN